MYFCQVHALTKIIGIASFAGGERTGETHGFPWPLSFGGAFRPALCFAQEPRRFPGLFSCFGNFSVSLAVLISRCYDRITDIQKEDAP